MATQSLNRGDHGGVSRSAATPAKHGQDLRLLRWHRRPLGAAVVAFVAHAALVVLWMALEDQQSGWLLRQVMERLVDWPAWRLFFVFQTSDPSRTQLAVLPFVKAFGLQPGLQVFRATWYIVLGGAPYAILAGLTAPLRLRIKHPRPDA